MKVKVIENSWTVYLKETRQTNVELDDGRIIKVRQMDDGNGTENYYFIDGESNEWSETHKCDNKELRDIVDKIAGNIFSGAFSKEYGDIESGDVVDLDELDDMF